MAGGVLRTLGLSLTIPANSQFFLEGSKLKRFFRIVFQSAMRSSLRVPATHFVLQSRQAGLLLHMWPDVWPSSYTVWPALVVHVWLALAVPALAVHVWPALVCVCMSVQEQRRMMNSVDDERATLGLLLPLPSLEEAGDNNNT